MSWRPLSFSQVGGRTLSRLCGITIAGSHNVPACGPLIVTPNHAHRQLDPLVLALATPRRATFISGADLRRQPIVRLAADLGHVLYVTPGLTALRDLRQRCQERLARGGAIVIFPEGAPMGNGAGHFRHGAAYLAVFTHTTVLPVWIDRTGWRRFTVRFGPPIPPLLAAANRHTLTHLTQQIRAAILALRCADDLSHQEEAICAI